MLVYIERTKKGLPALWEQGGGATNTGSAQVICGAHGERLTPVYVPTGGHLSSGQHALLVVTTSCYVIRANHHRLDFSITVDRIAEFGIDESGADVAVLENVAVFDRGEWDIEVPEYLLGAVDAVMEKARCYHCRRPHFIVDKKV